MPSKCGRQNRKISFGCAYLSTKGDQFCLGIAASDFTLFCYVRNVVFSFNLPCQHRAIMPPQQKCKNRPCKENKSNQPNEQCPHKKVPLKTTGVVLILSPAFFRDVR